MNNNNKYKTSVIQCVSFNFIDHIVILIEQYFFLLYLYYNIVWISFLSYSVNWIISFYLTGCWSYRRSIPTVNIVNILFALFFTPHVSSLIFFHFIFSPLSSSSSSSQSSLFCLFSVSSLPLFLLIQLFYIYAVESLIHDILKTDSILLLWYFIAWQLTISKISEISYLLLHGVLNSTILTLTSFPPLTHDPLIMSCDILYSELFSFSLFFSTSFSTSFLNTAIFDICW